MPEPMHVSTAPGNPILQAHPLRTMARLVPPSVAGTLIQSLILVVEAYWLGALGTEALAAIALVFPVYMLSNMLSTGAIGGSVSGTVARALGAGNGARAQAVMNAALVIAIVIGGLYGGLLLLAGETLYRLLGGDGAILAGALSYSRIVFGGIIILWLFNLLGACLRGAGDMLGQASGMAVVTVVHALTAAVLIPGRGPVPALGLRGAAIALLIAYAFGACYLVLLLARRAHAPRLARWHMPGADVLQPLARLGALSSGQSVLTIGYSLIATGLIARLGNEWLAGYGIGLRLELLMIPVIFGMGGALIAICGAFVGAGQRARAIRIAWGGAATTAVVVGGIGAVLAWQPALWHGLFTQDAAVAQASAHYLRIVGPCYAFFGLGLCLFFASQGTDNLPIPLGGTVLRLLIVGIGATVIGAGGMRPNPDTAFGLIASAMVLYGSAIALGLRFGPWRPRPVSVPGSAS